MRNRNIEAEQSVLGAVIMAPERTLAHTCGELTPEDFGEPVCRHLFAALRQMWMDGIPVDVVTLLGQVGQEYKEQIATVCQAAPTISNFRQYVTMVKEASQRRRAYETALELTGALTEEQPIQSCHTLAAKTCELLGQRGGEKVVSAKDGFLAFCVTKSKPKTYLPTGFSELDRRLYIDRGDYLVIGGRPSAGKTAFTLQMALHMAQSHRVAYFSLETSAAKIYERLIANYTSTPFGEVKAHRIKDWPGVTRWNRDFSALNLYVVEAAGWTVAQIRAKAAQLEAEVVFIDYLSLIKGEGKSLYERVTNLSMELHTFAQQAKVTVVALSQLNRDDRGEPGLTNLRESGQIEQDADGVILLFEPARAEPGVNRILSVAKNKDGRTGEIPLCFDGSLQRFREVEGRYA